VEGHGDDESSCLTLASDLVASVTTGSARSPGRSAATHLWPTGLPGCPSPQDASRMAETASRLFCRPPHPGSRRACRPPEPLRLPPPLSQLPWDIAQSEFGVKGADFIGVMGNYWCMPRNPSCWPMHLIPGQMETHFPASGAIGDASWARLALAVGRESVMRLEFHQLDRRWEHLRVRRAERQRRLLPRWLPWVSRCRLWSWPRRTSLSVTW